MAVSGRTLIALAVLDVGLFFLLNNVSDTLQKVLLPLFALGLLLLIVLSVRTLSRRLARMR
jgi:hypothetical protein